MDTRKSTLDFLLPQDRAQLSELYQVIITPLWTDLLKKAGKTSPSLAESYIKQSTLALWAGCHRNTANKACNRAVAIGIFTKSWTQKDKGPHPGHFGTNCSGIGAKYRKLLTLLWLPPEAAPTQGSPELRPGQTVAEYLHDFRKKMGWTDD